MKRRQYLTATAVAAAGLAGCLGGSDDPESVAESYLEAIADGDAQAYNSLIHPDSNIEEVGEDEEETFEAFTEEIEISVEDTELLEEDDDTAVVRVEATISSGDEEETNEGEIELRTDDGEWKVYEER